MAHHSSEHPLMKELQRKLAKQAQNRDAGSNMLPGSGEATRQFLENLGATGEYPEGRYGPHDEGAIRFGIAADEGKVLIDFGTPVRSLGMLPEQADLLAQSLMEKARQARAQRR